jgi:hypothetical protein
MMQTAMAAIEAPRGPVITAETMIRPTEVNFMVEKNMIGFQVFSKPGLELDRERCPVACVSHF